MSTDSKPSQKKKNKQLEKELKQLAASLYKLRRLPYFTKSKILTLVLCFTVMKHCLPYNFGFLLQFCDLNIQKFPEAINMCISYHNIIFAF